MTCLVEKDGWIYPWAENIDVVGSWVCRYPTAISWVKREVAYPWSHSYWKSPVKALAIGPKRRAWYFNEPHMISNEIDVIVSWNVVATTNNPRGIALATRISIIRYMTLFLEYCLRLHSKCRRSQDCRVNRSCYCWLCGRNVLVQFPMAFWLLHDWQHLLFSIGWSNTHSHYWK